MAWGDTEHLLAAAVDALRGANWQRGGGKGARPRPIPRPGSENGTKHMGKPRPIAEARAILDRWKAGGLAEAG